MTQTVKVHHNKRGQRKADGHSGIIKVPRPEQAVRTRTAFRGCYVPWSILNDLLIKPVSSGMFHNRIPFSRVRRVLKNILDSRSFFLSHPKTVTSYIPLLYGKYNKYGLNKMLNMARPIVPKVIVYLCMHSKP